MMSKKLAIILRGKFKNVYVLCHNFHASKKGWLQYKSLCEITSIHQMESYNIFSHAFFSRKTTFLSIDRSYSITKNMIKKSIIKTRGKKFYAKMISAFYENEKKDAMEIQIKIPKNFDKIKIVKFENSLKIEG